jgi:hypothetical protein
VSVRIELTKAFIPLQCSGLLPFRSANSLYHLFPTKDLNLPSVNNSSELPDRAITEEIWRTGVGFEPTEDFSSTVFKTVALNHSANLPYWWTVPESNWSLRAWPHPTAQTCSERPCSLSPSLIGALRCNSSSGRSHFAGVYDASLQRLPFVTSVTTVNLCPFIRY